MSELQCSHPKIITLTLLFVSSSNTGFLGRGEGDGINVASRGISGSVKTIPKINMTNTYFTLQMTVSKYQSRVNYFWMSLLCNHIVSKSSPAYFNNLKRVSPCDFSISYASKTFASSGRDRVQLYSISITFVFTLSDTLSPRY